MQRKKKINFNRFVYIFIALFFVLAGCHEYTDLGIDLIPGGGKDQIKRTDTFSIKTKVIAVSQDSSLSSQSAGVEIGSINSDSIFGKSTSALYLQFGLSTNEIEFATPNPVIDSVVVSLAYFGAYGDSTDKQTYTVYQINDPAFNDKSRNYYVHQRFAIDEARPLGSTTISSERLKDSVSLYGTKEPPQLRIKLDDDFGASFLEQDAKQAFKNDSAFHQWLNGLAIFPDSTLPDKRSMTYFNLSSDFTGISIFYHTDDKDSLTGYFPSKPNTGVWSNYHSSDFSDTPLEEVLQSTEESDSLIYLIDNAGVFVNVDLPHLEEFPNALINKAELVITQIDDPSNSTFPEPYELFLWRYTTENRDSVDYIRDLGAVFDQFNGWQFTNLATFGGVKKTVKNKEGKEVAQYTFNITRYFQSLISNKANKVDYHGFRLGILDPQNRSINTGRLIMGGGNHPDYPMKFKVIYTEIE